MTRLLLRALLIGISVLAAQAAAGSLLGRQSASRDQNDRNPLSLDASVVKRVEPVYPPFAKAARASGQVVVAVTVDSKGDVIAAQPLSGHPLLKDAAVAAARGCKFAAGTEGKNKVGTLTFTFSLDTQKTNDSSDSSEIEEARKAVKANPSSAEAHRELAEAYADEDLYKEAIAEFEEALRLKPDDLDSFMGLADSYNHSGKTDDAIATLNKAVAAFPDKRQPLDRLIPLLTSKEQFLEAVQVQKRLCGLDSKNSACLVALGYYAMRAARPDEAVEAYKKAIELSPKSATHYHGLGSAYMALGRYQDALDAFKQALANEPAYSQGYLVQYGIGGACMNLNRREEAMQAFKKSVEINPRFANGHMAIAAVHHQSSEYEEAESELKAAIALAARSPGAHYSLGEIYLHEGRLEEGEKSFREAIKFSPDFPAAHFGLAASLLLQKKGPEAEAAITEAVRFRVSGTAGYILLGSMLTHLGDNAAGETIYRRAYEADPNNHLLLNNLGYTMLERDENIEEAFKMIQRAVNVQPTNGAYLDSLGWAYYKLGKLEEAERYLLDAIRYTANSATIREHLGDVYEKRGNISMAKGAWQQALSLASEREQTARLKAKLAGESKK